MNIRIILAAVLTAASSVALAEPFKVITPLTPDMDGTVARLLNYDTGEVIDSTVVADHAATFTGIIDEPVLARVVVGAQRLPIFVLESGTISFSRENVPFGTMLNDEARRTDLALKEYVDRYYSASSLAEAEAAEAAFNVAVDSAMRANADNPLGFYYFLQGPGMSADAATLRAIFKSYPELGRYRSSAALLAEAEHRESTMEGKPFVDFEVTYNGTTKRLSDYVGRGHYTLVDFWASWCGPCMRQVPVLKDIYNEYKDKGLDVLGVAVWDKPADTELAIRRHGLPWDNIIDAQKIPTDIYGITGIPCIILFGPDGTIISRGKQGDELRAEVAKAMKGN